MSIVGLNEAIDLGREFFSAAEGSPADGPLGDDREPGFPLIEPGGLGGGEVEVAARSRCQPAPDAGMFVGRVVVHNQMPVQGRRDLCLQMTQELEKLLVAMPTLALADHRAAGQVQGREQGGGAVRT